MTTQRGRQAQLFSLIAIVVAIAAAAATAGETISPNAEIAYGGPLSGLPDATIRRYNSITSELYADLMGTTVTAQKHFREALPSITDYCQSAHLVSSSYCEPDATWVMWDTPFVSRDAREENAGHFGHKQTVSGFATGVSAMLDDTTAVGLAVGYDARKLTGRDGYHWRNKADAFHAAIYGGTAIGCFFIDGYAGFSRAWQRTERDVHGPTIERNHGNYNDTVLSAGVKASYVWILDNDMRVVTAVGLDFSQVRLSGFRETGSGDTRLAVGDARHSSLQTPVSVALNKTFVSDFLAFDGKSSLWTPEVRAAFVPQFGAKRTSTAYSVAGGALPGQFTAHSTEFGGCYGSVGAGMKIKLRDKFIFAVDYDYLAGEKYDRHVVTGTYGVSF